MNQTFSWSAFLSGMTTFVGIAGEIVTQHTQWSDFAQPLGVIHLLVLGTAFAVMVAGALGVQLPRSSNGVHGDRAGDHPAAAAGAAVPPPSSPPHP